MDTTKNKRCSWCRNNTLSIKYHDEEWGVPLYKDSKIFEILLLETFQAGLSWITILKKRENFRKAFSNFNYIEISKYSNQRLAKLKLNRDIICNTLKINAAKTNAIAFINLQKEFGSFSKYIWGFVNEKPIQNNFILNHDIPSNTKLSNKISKDLKKRGFKFMGKTIVYALMQAIGIVNDHTINCFRHQEIAILNKKNYDYF